MKHIPAALAGILISSVALAACAPAPNAAQTVSSHMSTAPNYTSSMQSSTTETTTLSSSTDAPTMAESAFQMNDSQSEIPPLPLHFPEPPDTRFLSHQDQIMDMAYINPNIEDLLAEEHLDTSAVPSGAA